MEKDKVQLADISEMRFLIERSPKFVYLSGMSGISLVIIAVLGSVILGCIYNSDSLNKSCGIMLINRIA